MKMYFIGTNFLFFRGKIKELQSELKNFSSKYSTIQELFKAHLN